MIYKLTKGPTRFPVFKLTPITNSLLRQCLFDACESDCIDQRRQQHPSLYTFRADSWKINVLLVIVGFRTNDAALSAISAFVCTLIQKVSLVTGEGRRENVKL